MSARAQTLLWLAQRASGALLAIFVVTHLATVIYAVHGGLSAHEILGRVRGDPGWLVFYGSFVVTVAVHAPIGMRAVLTELTPLPPRVIDATLGLVSASLLLLGGNAAWTLYAAPLG